jgi:hypothetical protein
VVSSDFDRVRCALLRSFLVRNWCGQWPTVILGRARPMDCTDGSRLEDGHEHHEAQRSNAKREDTQNFFHIGSYACSISR